MLDCIVATREGGVDRNMKLHEFQKESNRSPPARVAWIETSSLVMSTASTVRSPPARVAWIETALSCFVLLNLAGRHPRGWRG